MVILQDAALVRLHKTSNHRAARGSVVAKNSLGLNVAGEIRYSSIIRRVLTLPPLASKAKQYAASSLPETVFTP